MTQAKRSLELIECWQVPDQAADASYLEQEGFEDRLAEYQRGEFGFIGVQAVAHVYVNGVRQVIKSGGLWGIESDSDIAYIKEIEQEQLAELSAILGAMDFTPEEIKQAR